MAHYDEKDREVVAWVPGVLALAPKLPYGVVPNLYKTKTACLRHPHWEQHKPYATARMIEVADGVVKDSHRYVGEALAYLSMTGADSDERLVLRYLEESRFASALVLAWSAGLVG
jgi:hypothetical protein